MVYDLLCLILFYYQKTYFLFLFLVIFSRFSQINLFISAFYAIFAGINIFFMIQEFKVKNFFSIREEQTLSFVPNADTDKRDMYVRKVSEDVELLKIGIVYGSNASGKTTILRAFDFFCEIMLDKPMSKNAAIPFYPFLLDAHSQTERSEMSMTFWIRGERYVLDIEFDLDRIYGERLNVYVSNRRPTLLYKREYDKDKDYSNVTFGKKAGIDMVTKRAIMGNTTNNCTVMAAFGQSNTVASRLNDVYDFFFTSMNEILSPRDTLSFYVRDELNNDTNGKLRSFLLKMLSMSDFNIVDMAIENIEEKITPEMEKVIMNSPMPDEKKIEMLRRGTVRHDDLVFRHRGDNGLFAIHEQLESAGTMRFLEMSAMLYHAINDNSLFLVDEIESSIHYELLAYYIKLFLANSEGTSQLLITTHDINLLNEDFIRRDVIWFTDKDKCGATALKRLSDLGLHKTLSPYNAYRQGKLVGLPSLGSVYLDK